MARQGTDFDDVKGGGREKKSRPSDKVDVYTFPEKKWVTIRLVGKVFAYAGYWITGKSKEGKQIKYYVECPSFDPATQERDTTIYDPWRDAEAKLRADAGDTPKGQQKPQLPINFTRSFWVCAINRLAQKKFDPSQNKPTKLERTSGFKDKDSDTATPLVPIRLPASLANKIKELKALNTVEGRSGEVRSFPVSHPKFGCDIRVYYDSTKPPADQYQVVPRENKSPLSEEELAYLPWDLSELGEPDTEEGTKSNFERWANSVGFKLAAAKKKKAVVEDDDDEDEEEEEDDEPAPKSKKKPAAKKKAAADEDDDFDDEDEEEEDDEPAPKSKKKPAAKKKAVVEDDDEDEEEDDFDDEEDDTPPPKKKPASKKKAVVEDDDDFDDEEEDDEPAPKKKPAAKKKTAVDDDFDDEEEDEPAPKSKKKPAPKKKAVADDDFDDEDEEEEDEEEDEPAPKKKPAAKKKAVVEDDDDFDDDEEDEDEDDLPPPKKKPAAKRR